MWIAVCRKCPCRRGSLYDSQSLSGRACFLSYCRYIKCSDQAVLIAVFTYLCNGYILNYCIAQNVFIELYILLPLLLLGTEKLQKEKKERDLYCLHCVSGNFAAVKSVYHDTDLSRLSVCALYLQRRKQKF